MLSIVAPRVCFIDDDPAVRTVVARILRGVGIGVDCFVDPATCLVALRSQECDLLITNLKSDGVALRGVLSP